MDIREYLQKEQKGFYNIIAKTLTVERRKQLYNAINNWHESELKLLGIADVVGRSEQLESGLTCMMCRKPKQNDGHTCCEECAGLAF